MWVTIAIGIAEQFAILTDKCEIHSPCVDTDGTDGNVVFGYCFESVDDLAVKGINVPVTMTAGLYYMIGKAGNLFQL